MSSDLLILLLVLAGASFSVLCMLALNSIRRSRKRLRQLRVEGFTVWVETFRKGSGVRLLYTRCVLDSAGRIPPELVLGKESLLSAASRVLSDGDVRLHDERFDSQVLVQGPEELALATLDVRARQAVARFVRRGGAVRRGSVCLERPGILTNEQVEAAVAEQLPVVRAFSQRSVPDGLLANAERDPSPRLRLRCHELIRSRFPDTPEAEEAIRVGLADQAPEIRLSVARDAPRWVEVRTVLKNLSLSAVATIEVRVEALEALSSEPDEPGFAPLLAQVLQTGPVPLRQAAARLAGALQTPALQAAFETLVHAPEPEVALLAARGLSSYGDAEPALMRLLEHPSDEVKAAAAEGLARVGSIRAVESLLPLAERTLGSPVKTAAKRAIQSIQGRLLHAGEGQLSVVDDHAREGSVSLVPEPPERIKD